MSLPQWHDENKSPSHCYGHGEIPSIAVATATAMIVAVTNSKADNPEHETVIGCVAVKRGCDETTDAAVTDHRFAIFRWSVDEHCRGSGVGKALVIAAEEFARQNAGTELWATTANPISSLSLTKMGFVTTFSFFGYCHLYKKLK